MRADLIVREGVEMKSTTKHIFWSAFGTLLALVAIAAIVIQFGAVNMAASQPPGKVEQGLARWTVGRSVDMRSHDELNPVAGDESAIETGLHLFREMCIQCHGAPKIESEPFAKGLNPPAPELSIVLDEWSDGELFWIVKNGIRMTGMPAFGVTLQDQEIWGIVAGMRQLPELTETQVQELRQRGGLGP
jgi:mono/diheme cytochrome c family protein